VPLSELADCFGISRKSAYKWLERSERLGMEGLKDASRAPKTSPQATSTALVKRLVALKQKHPSFGPKKLLWLLSQQGVSGLPSASTAGEILKRRGLVRPRRPPEGIVAPVAHHLTKPERPNHVWCADFKGEFKLLNGTYCWPLTVTDAATRYALACVAMVGPHGEPTRRVFERLFEEYGLPEIIRTDNGTPFASNGLWGLTTVSGYWLRCGVRSERTRPGKPQDNGRHERFHRTLKEATAMPPAASMKAQQHAFDAFCEEYNFVRPHESLNDQPPGWLYAPSARLKPKNLSEPEYPRHFYVCRGTVNGTLKINKVVFFIGRWTTHANLGLEELPGERFRVHYARHALGELDLRSGKVIPYGSQGSPGRPPPFDSAHELHNTPQA
jgi:transposase InsO family protein